MGRLDEEQICWLATVRPDGRPHLTPIWFVWVRGRFWMCTGSRAVKTRNIATNPAVSISLTSGTDPLIAEGRAALHRRPYPEDVVGAFLRAFSWDISRDAPAETYDTLIEVAVERWLMGSP